MLLLNNKLINVMIIIFQIKSDFYLHRDKVIHYFILCNNTLLKSSKKTNVIFSQNSLLLLPDHRACLKL